MTRAAADAKARTFLQHQIDSAKGDGKDLVTSFTPDAVVLVHGSSSTADRVSMWGIGDSGPDGATTAKVAITKLVAAGTPDAVWFYADVTTQSRGPGKPAVTRVVELIVASENWRAVAASFGMGAALQVSGDNMEIPNATGTDGPLTKLLASTSAIGGALDPNAIVVGPTDAQVKQGGGAKGALLKWKLDPITLYKRSREVDRPTWGLAQVYYDHATAKPTDIERGIAQAFALPKSDGTWNVVLVQYRAE
jgi:hypothetical protein